MNAPLQVLRQTPRWVVIDKPPGMLSVPGRGPDKQDCASARVQAMFPEATGPLSVHRLDMETSGLMVFALDAQAHRALSIQFENRQTSKRYIALIEANGRDIPDTGQINVPMRPDIDNRPLQMIDTEKGRPSTTNFQILDRQPGQIRIGFEPITGRTHQLRVHAAAPSTLPNGEPGGLASPIRGDTLYGGAPPPPQRGRWPSLRRPEGVPSPVLPNGDLPRMMLHATFLGFDDPETLQRIEIESPVPF